jgi:hypothetical protein
VKRKRWTPLLAAVAVAATLTAASPAMARFSVGPTVQRLSLDPGEAVSGLTRVRLVGADGGSFVVQLEDIRQRPDGSLYYTAPSDSPFSASSWIEVTPRRFSARPNRIQPIEYVVRVPLDAEPGDHLASLTIKRLPPGERSGIAEIQAVAVRLELRVAGKLRESVDLDSLEVPTVAGTAPVGLGALLRNNGNVRLDFDRQNKGALAVRDGDARAGERLSGVLYPGQERYVGLDWEDPPLLGHPTATVSVLTRRGRIARSASFWLVPWRQAAALALVALAATAVVLGWRRRRAPPRRKHA